ncbi:MAG: hypothetical protein ACOC2F_02915, partial [Bacteroidota bacterium]
MVNFLNPPAEKSGQDFVLRQTFYKKFITQKLPLLNISLSNYELKTNTQAGGNAKCFTKSQNK